MMKKCTNCGIEKDQSAFYNGRNKCKSCMKEYRAQYYQNNKEEQIKRSKQYNQEHKEEVNERNKRYYQENKKESNEKSKQYRKDHKNELKEYNRQYSKQYYQENKNKLKERTKKYRHENKEQIKQYRENNKDKIRERHNQYGIKRRSEDAAYKLRCNFSSSMSRILKSRNTSKKEYSCFDLVPYSLQDLIQHIENQFEPWMNWSNQGIYNPETWDDNDSSTWTWQLDHEIPQSDFTFQSATDPGFQECWALKNLRPLKAKDNILDGANRKRHSSKK